MTDEKKNKEQLILDTSDHYQYYIDYSILFYYFYGYPQYYRNI